MKLLVIKIWSVAPSPLGANTLTLLIFPSLLVDVSDDRPCCFASEGSDACWRGKGKTPCSSVASVCMEAAHKAVFVTTHRL